jgi:hypothetical protein
MSIALFPLGETVITRAALDVLHPEDVKLCLDRHANGDWGELDVHDWKENEVALVQGLRLFSVYHDRTHIKFYIISEQDRSATTVLLPEDY